MADLESLQQKIIAFRTERDWAQFHDPMNLAEALSIEAAELLESFLWKTTEQSRNLTEETITGITRPRKQERPIPVLPAMLLRSTPPLRRLPR
jgi:hypothetical protein